MIILYSNFAINSFSGKNGFWEEIFLKFSLNILILKFIPPPPTNLEVFLSGCDKYLYTYKYHEWCFSTMFCFPVMSTLCKRDTRYKIMTYELFKNGLPDKESRKRPHSAESTEEEEPKKKKPLNVEWVSDAVRWNCFVLFCFFPFSCFLLFKKFFFAFPKSFCITKKMK